jgi:protein-S-isoprenylcysteine O-methyltransferase Ste14
MTVEQFQNTCSERRKVMAFNKNVIRGSVAVFYLLIGLEIIIMVSPFAAYFYAAYGPLLNFLYAYPATAWLTGFFLPHAVVSKSALLNFTNSFGHILFSLGIIAFLLGAIQIYSAKFRRKGVVTGWLYRWIRHPQYLFLAIAGLGLMLFWPRFFILMLYISMLFVCCLLARYEEQQMLAQHGESYGAYVRHTAMFIPGEPGGKIFSRFVWLEQIARLGADTCLRGRTGAGRCRWPGFAQLHHFANGNGLRAHETDGGDFDFAAAGTIAAKNSRHRVSG